MSRRAGIDRQIWKRFDGYVHGFHNDTTPRYDMIAAELAWIRTVEFFEKYLQIDG